MMSVKRYGAEVWNHPVRGEDARMVEDAEGNYVRYSDYEELRASHEELLKATAAFAVFAEPFVCLAGVPVELEALGDAPGNAQKVRER
jgi:hypothetical protein